MEYVFVIEKIMCDEIGSIYMWFSKYPSGTETEIVRFNRGYALVRVRVKKQTDIVNSKT